jgi:hypothetical protein
MTRSRSATGLKSTTARPPLSNRSLSWLTRVAVPVAVSTVTICPESVRPYSLPSAGRTSMPTSLPAAPLTRTGGDARRVSVSMR